MGEGGEAGGGDGGGGDGGGGNTGGGSVGSGGGLGGDKFITQHLLQSQPIASKLRHVRMP